MLKFVIVLVLVALAVYLTVRALDRRAASQAQGRVVAPDDDPNFLADLDFERRRQRKHRPEPGPSASDEQAEDTDQP